MTQLRYLDLNPSVIQQDMKNIVSNDDLVYLGSMYAEPLKSVTYELLHLVYRNMIGVIELTGVTHSLQLQRTPAQS